MVAADFLDLPARAAKPRGTGITHILDRGIPLGQSADLLAMNGSFVDVWKLGWGISYLDPNLAAKLELLARHRVLASPGGTLLEIAWAQGRAAEFLGWARDCGFPCVEVSSGTVPMDAAAKQDLIAEASRHFIVLAEVGPKDPGIRLTPAQWAQAVSRDLESGATWVLAEGRASGTVGIHDRSGAVRQDIVDAPALAACRHPRSVVAGSRARGQDVTGPAVNLVPSQYRNVSVADVPVAL